MGVHGLWRLIEPSGKPVPLETLENKVLAVGILSKLRFFLHVLQKHEHSHLNTTQRYFHMAAPGS